MRRRDVIPAAASAALLAAQTGSSAKPAILELRRFQMRNTADNQVKRTSDYLQATFVPAVKRAGATTVGAFNNNVGADSPYLLVLTEFPTLADYETAHAKLADDADYQKQTDAYNGTGNPGYVRMETSLLRGFATMPRIEIPSQEGRTSTRLFELRTYESNTTTSLARKVRMFNEGEIAIFRKSEMIPIFFGETIVGTKMPNLTYMLAYDDMTAREKVWRTFVTSPEWKKLSSQPGLSDAEIVSNISNSFLKPLAFSMVK